MASGLYILHPHVRIPLANRKSPCFPRVLPLTGPSISLASLSLPRYALTSLPHSVPYATSWPCLNCPSVALLPPAATLAFRWTATPRTPSLAITHPAAHQLPPHNSPSSRSLQGSSHCARCPAAAGAHPCAPADPSPPCSPPQTAPTYCQSRTWPAHTPGPTTAADPALRPAPPAHR